MSDKNKDRIAEQVQSLDSAFAPPEGEDAEVEDNNYGDPQLEDPRFETRGTVHDGVDNYTVPKEGEPVEGDEDTSNAENRIEVPEETEEKDDRENVVDWREKYYQSQFESQERQLAEMKRTIEELKAKGGPSSETPEPEPLGGRDIDDVITDPKIFDEAVTERVNAVLQPIIERVNQLEQGVQAVPDEVQNRVRVTQNLENQVNDWYSRNPDIDFRKATSPSDQRKLKIMMQIAEDYHSQYPNKPVAEVLDMVGDEARDLFQMKTPRPGRSNDPKSSLASGRPTSRSSGGPREAPKPRAIDEILQGIM